MLVLLTAVCAVTGNAPPASGNEAASNFKLRCSSCHGLNGSGDTSLGKTLKAADLRSPEVRKQTDAQLAQVIANGRNNMPPFVNSLTREEVRALVAYIRKLAEKVQK